MIMTGALLNVKVQRLYSDKHIWTNGYNNRVTVSQVKVTFSFSLKLIATGFLHLMYTSINPTGVSSSLECWSPQIRISMSLMVGTVRVVRNHGPEVGAQQVGLLPHPAIPSQSGSSVKSVLRHPPPPGLPESQKELFPMKFMFSVK